jgi:hypothetical protein
VLEKREPRSKQQVKNIINYRYVVESVRRFFRETLSEMARDPESVRVQERASGEIFWV